jgi:hypothetical protein
MDAHENEYLGAAEGMAETYGRKPAEHAVGDQVWFRRADMTYPAAARVIEVTPLGAYVVADEAGNRSTIFADDIVSL